MKTTFHTLLAATVALLAAGCGQTPTTTTDGATAEGRYIRDTKSAEGVIVIPASDFLDQLAEDHTTPDAATLGVERVFNNLAISVKTPAGFTIPNYLKQVDIPADGDYYVYVRAIGSGDGAFRVRLNNAYIDGSFADTPGATFTRTGPFALKAGTVPLLVTRMTGTPAFDVFAVTTRGDLTEDELFAHQYPDEVTLVKEYDIPGAKHLKFGDVDGDGRTDVLAITANYSTIVVDHDGNELWRWDAPEERSVLRAEFEGPGAIWDLDRDGKGEVIQWREFDGREWLVVADGTTGAIKHQTPWPTVPHPHVYNNFRLAIGRLSGDYPQNILVYTDCGARRQQTITAYTADLEQLWEHKEVRLKDHLGHYVYPHDFLGRGVDQVLCGYVMLDADGTVIWNLQDDIYDNHDHADSWKWADLDADGDTELLMAGCDLGALAMDPADGTILWEHPAAHDQQIQVGHFLAGHDRPQVAAGARIYGYRQFEPYISGEVRWFDAEGNYLSTWPATALSGNPDFGRGDFYGDGSEVLFWYKFIMQPDGTGTLAFPEPIYHAFDFARNGATQAVTLSREGRVGIWGYTDVAARTPNNDPDYVRETMTNHTHY